MRRGFVVELLAPDENEDLHVIDKRGPTSSIGALAAWDRFAKEPGCYVQIRRPPS